MRPIRIIIGVQPGAGSDMVARATAQILTEKWGQNAVVDPRPGGGGVIASELTAKSALEAIDAPQAEVAFFAGKGLFQFILAQIRDTP